MAYDEQLAARVSELIHAPPGRRRAQDVRRDGLDDRRQHGRAASCATTSLIVRIAPEEVDEALARAARDASSGARASKPMKGFVMIDPIALADDAELAALGRVRRRARVGAAA